MRRIKRKIANSNKAKSFIMTNSKIKAINVLKIEKLISHKKYDIAIENLNELIESKPSLKYYTLLADAYLKSKNFVEAKKILEQYPRAGSHYHRDYALALQGSNNMYEAVKSWSNVKQISILSKPELLSAAVANLYVGDEQVAMIYLDSFIEKNKKDTPIWEVLAKNNHWNFAVKFLQTHVDNLVDSELTAEVLYRLGFMYVKNFDYQNAIKYIKLAIALEDNPLYAYTLAGVYQHTKQFDLGIEVLAESSLLGMIDQYKVTYLLGSLYMNNGDLENCAKTFIDYPPLAEISTDEVLNNVHYVLGLEAEANGDIKEAIKQYIEVTYTYNGHCKLLFTKIGELYYQLGDLKNACKYFLSYNISQDFPIYPLSKSGYTKDVINYSEYYDRLEVKENFVLYVSFSGANFTGSPYSIFKELYKREELVHFVVYNGEETRNSDVEKLDNVYCVQANSKLHRRLLCQAKFLITNGTFPYAYIAKEEQVVINTWHGTPIKYLGYDVEDASYLLSRNVRNSLITSTLMIHPNQFTMDAMNNSFKLEGVSDTKIEVTGYPRQDLMINLTAERRQEIIEYLEVDTTKPIVLYAPTYRDSLLVTGEQRDDQMLEAVSKLSQSTEYNFLFKGHYFDESAKNKTNDLDTNELLGIVDILVSDYSSIAIDFMAMKKPIIYYTYDLEEYRAERGFYFELETITNSMVSTLSELESKIVEKLNNHQLDEQQVEATKKFCYLDDGKATKRVVDLALEARAPITNDKKQVLLYAGNLLTINNSTNKLEELLSTYDPNTVDVTILLDESELKKGLDESYIDQLIERGFQITFYYGTVSRTIIEDAALELFNKNFGFVSAEHKNICIKMVQRNAKRLFGRAKYDQIDILENGNNSEITLTLCGLDINEKNLFCSQSKASLISYYPMSRVNFELYDQFL